MEGDISGRDNIAKLIIDYHGTQANVFQIVFGSGSDGTLRLIGAYAHNDWLEILFNQGIVGIIMYVIYWISFLSNGWGLLDLVKNIW